MLACISSGLSVWLAVVLLVVSLLSMSVYFSTQSTHTLSNNDEQKPGVCCMFYIFSLRAKPDMHLGTINSVFSLVIFPMNKDCSNSFGELP